MIIRNQDGASEGGHDYTQRIPRRMKKHQFRRQEPKLPHPAFRFRENGQQGGGRPH